MLHQTMKRTKMKQPRNHETSLSIDLCSANRILKILNTELTNKDMRYLLEERSCSYLVDGKKCAGLQVSVNCTHTN